MILVDDGLAARILAGKASAYWPDEVPSVAWGFYVRLLTVLRRNSRRPSEITRPGKITRLATDFLAAAIHHQTPLHVIEGNVGRNWQTLCDAEGVELRIVPENE